MKKNTKKASPARSTAFSLLVGAIHAAARNIPEDGLGEIELVRSWLSRAEIIRDVIVLNRREIDDSLELSCELNGYSEFELMMALYLADTDRHCVASLVNELCVNSLDDDFLKSLMHDVRANAEGAILAFAPGAAT